MITELNTQFTVYPSDTNSMAPMIFGGALFSHLDKTAALLTKQLLFSSESCKSAVTHKFTGTFHKPCYTGDIIHIHAKAMSVGKKSIVIHVEAYRRNSPSENELIADADFVFVTIMHDSDVADKPKLLPYYQHGIVL